MRNESKYICSCLDSLVCQTFPPGEYEVVVADGRSTDNSRQLVSRYQGRPVTVRLLDNQSQNTPSGMNLGISAANGKVVIIAGAHTVYPTDFVENCVRWLDKTGADVVGGPLETKVESDSLGGRLASLILSSPFGVGNSRFRTSSAEGYVDTVPFGAYRRTILDRVGLFNEKLVRNQDNDLSSRIRLAGGKIYLTPALKTIYIPVRGYADLLRQAFTKTQWHLFTLRENKRALTFRHLLPSVFVIFAAGLLLLSIWNTLARNSLGLLAAMYLCVGFWFAARDKSPVWLRALMPLACFPFHSAYGLGTLVGLRHLFNTESIDIAPRAGDARRDEIAEVPPVRPR